jgi:tetratricopeptide (TPR) repeat protein
MTTKQVERIQAKILKIKKALAADKRRWGGYYDDSQGLRYLPPELYLKIRDYKGALRYFNWFAKNFPDDIGYPVFLFEWAITLFKTNRLEQAENKALRTFYGNPYLLDGFLQRQLPDPGLYESSNWESRDLIDSLPYSKAQEELADFTAWLEGFMNSEKFTAFAQQIQAIRQALKKDPAWEERTALLQAEWRLRDAVS